MSNAREESEIFSDLARLCVSPGFVHALAYLCFRDNYVGYTGEMSSKDMSKMYDRNRLIGTEQSTLIGLMLRKAVDWGNPGEERIHEYASSAQALLEELHGALSGAFKFDAAEAVEPSYSPFSTGDALREPIFYSGESAYEFQYVDLTPLKYGADDNWLLANMGFSSASAAQIVRKMMELQNASAAKHLHSILRPDTESVSIIDALAISPQGIVDGAGIAAREVNAFLTAFTFSSKERNDAFNHINDANAAKFKPLLPTPDGRVLILQQHAFAEALYESPFYWMISDASYKGAASDNRGAFTEEFCRDRLADVFGKENVFANVDLLKSKGGKAGEIDVLAVHGKRAIVLQAKSKRLTLEARKGNTGALQDDFAKGIQKAYEQGKSCAELLLSRECELRNADGDVVQLCTSIEVVYVLCVLSDHYPALSFQARQFLKVTPTDSIPSPYVLDVFALDTAAEFLNSPLRFLSYLDRRTRYADRILASNELTILGMHLRSNLWLEDGLHLMFIEDDISAELDVAMAVRRRGVPGRATPEGVLTRLSATTIGDVIAQIESSNNSSTIDLGFLLLQVSEDAVIDGSLAIDTIAARAVADRQPHDASLGFADGTGVTFHCNYFDDGEAERRLRKHCEHRKYAQKADSWFGVCLDPGTLKLRFALHVEGPWMHDEVLDRAAKHLKTGAPTFAQQIGTKDPRIVEIARGKVGRNDPCPCGSGRKFKKCCIDR